MVSTVDGDVPVHLRDALGGIAVEVAEDDNAFVVGLVPVVEDEVAAWGVVADVTDAGVRT